MAQEAFNSTNNINIPHNVSIWFQRDFSGNYVELGDLLVDGIALSPEFKDHRSYRNGINALRKRLLTGRSATVTATLHEPNIRTFERVIFGSTPVTGQSKTVYEGKHLTVQSDENGTFVDMADAGETDFDNIVVTGIYAASDALEASNLISANIDLVTDGYARFDGTDTGLDAGDIVYVKYSVTVASLYSTEIFGATNATVEGAAQLQARNLQGGVVQIWELASVNLASNGELSYPLDDVQTVPIILSLQERAGTFGKVYTK